MHSRIRPNLSSLCVVFQCTVYVTEQLISALMMLHAPPSHQVLICATDKWLKLHPVCIARSYDPPPVWNTFIMSIKHKRSRIVELISELHFTSLQKSQLKVVTYLKRQTNNIKRLCSSELKEVIRGYYCAKEIIGLLRQSIFHFLLVPRF